MNEELLSSSDQYLKKSNRMLLIIGIIAFLAFLTGVIVLLSGEEQQKEDAKVTIGNSAESSTNVLGGTGDRFNMNMPEEVNRILTDRISDVLFCPTNDAVMNLKAEGIEKNVYNVGDVMCDAVLYYGIQMDKHDSEYYKNRLVSLKFNRAQLGDEWYLATIHRAENTDDIGKIEQILAAFEMLDRQVIFPVHPRTKKLVESAVDKHGYQNIFFCEPMGYIDMLYFLKHAVKAVTDSGGLQKEAYILDTPCVTVREQTEWVETLGGNCNILAHPEKDDIYRKVAETRIDESAKRPYYGKGDAAEKILKILGGLI